MAKSLVIVGPGSATLATGFWEFFTNVGATAPDATESKVTKTIRTAGTFANLTVFAPTNTGSVATTVKSRKNGADGNLVVTIPASTTGVFQDTSHSDSVAAGDTVALSVDIGSGTGSTTWRCATASFDHATTAVSLFARGSHDMTANAGSRVTSITDSTVANATTETDSVRSLMRTACTLKNLQVNVSANARTTDTTYKSRKNGADGNCVVTIGAGLTGLFEDTTNSDSLAAGDKCCVRGTTGAGTETMTLTHSVLIESSNHVATFVGHRSAGSTINAAATAYIGLNVITATPETSIHRTFMPIAFTAKNFRLFVYTNTVTADSTLISRNNGADGNCAITIPASTTGYFEDTTHTDSVAAGTEYNFKMTAGATGTSMNIRVLGFDVDAGADPVASGGNLSLALLGVGA